MLAATLMAALLQVGWPLALAFHHHHEHAHADLLDHDAAHDPHEEHDPHDPSHCPTCQAIAQLRTAELPSLGSANVCQLVERVACQAIPQAGTSQPSLLSAPPRAPPAA
jgi:hypothetical protein